MANPTMSEKKWRKTERGIKVKKRNEYLSNLPSQNRSDSGGSCAVCERENLKRFVCGVFRSIPPFLPAPSSSTHHHHISQTSLSTPSNGSHQGLSLLSLSSLLLIIVIVAVVVANCTQIDGRWVFCHPTFTLLFSTFFLYSGKAPRKQLATKAARKTAQVCLLVTVTVGNTVLNPLIDCHWRS